MESDEPTVGTVGQTAGPQKLTESLKIRKWTKQQLDTRFGPRRKTYDAIITGLLMDDERWQKATGVKTPQDVPTKP